MLFGLMQPGLMLPGWMRMVQEPAVQAHPGWWELQGLEHPLAQRLSTGPFGPVRKV